MSNKKDHIKFSFWIFFLLFVIVMIFLSTDKINIFLEYLSYNKIHIIASLVLFFFWIILPDIIEPATSCWHRKIFHSKSLFYFIILFLIFVVLWFIYTPSLMYLYSWAIFFWYFSHLLLDKLTKRWLS